MKVSQQRRNKMNKFHIPYKNGFYGFNGLNGFNSALIQSTFILLLLFGENECFSVVKRSSSSKYGVDARSRIRNTNRRKSATGFDCSLTICKAKSFFGDVEGDNYEDEDDVEIGKYEVDASMLDPRKSARSLQESRSNTQLPETQDPTVRTDTQSQIEKQQIQIDMLMKMVQNQPQIQQQIQQPLQSMKPPLGQQSSDSDLLLPPPLPGMFDEDGEEELLDHINDPISAASAGLDPNSAASSPFGAQGGIVPVAPLKAMLFIDGTWLYYSLYRRKEEMDPIVKKFGKGWPYRYKFDWNALPRIVCEQIVSQQRDLGWSSTGSDADSAQNTAQRPVEIVRASVFTSYKKTTDPKSFRARMYNEMADANYDIHMLESTSNGPEKCVDISLAVEMLHYATVPNAYDVALLLSGDKDFIPAMVRTRQKGRKVGVVSMKTGCNRALYEGSHIKDFDVVWIDDFLDRLLVPLPTEQVHKNVQNVHDRGLLSAFTLTKVILDFVSQSPYGKVSSRDVGRYLKNLELDGGTSLLDDIKLGQGGLRRFLQDRMPAVFQVTDRTNFMTRDPNDKSYWITTKDGATNILLEEAKRSTFTKEEKDFLENYRSGVIERGAEEDIYFYTMEVLESGGNGGTNTWTNTMPSESKPNTMPSGSEQLIVESIDYSSWTVVRLKELCREKGLTVSGTKGVLIERIHQAEEEDSEKVQTADNSNLSEKEILEQYLINLVKYYIHECRGYASSRDLGRYLSTNQASTSASISALQELKNTFGGVAAFLNQRNHIFTTVREASDGDPNNYSFGIKLKEATRLPRDAPRPNSIPSSNTNTDMATHQSNHNQQVSTIDPRIDAHIESLLREYLHASGGEASSRNIGRYLSANSAVPIGQMGNGNGRNTALKQLKNSYGSVASYLNTKTDIFIKVQAGFRSGQGENDPPSDHDFGVRLK